VELQGVRLVSLRSSVETIFEAAVALISPAPMERQTAFETAVLLRDLCMLVRQRFKPLGKLPKLCFKSAMAVILHA